MTQARHGELGGMVSFVAGSPPFKALMLLLLLLPPHVMSTAYSHMCPCASPEPRNEAVVLLEEYLRDTTTRMRKLNCCAHHLLAAHDPHYHPNDTFTIMWSFKGKEYKVIDGKEQPWSRRVSSFETDFCGMQTLQSNSLRFLDEGVYSCVVTSSSGASVTKTFSLCLNVNENLGSPPLNSSISENTLALLRQAVSFNCSAYVGEPVCGRTGEYRLAWTKERLDGSWVEGSELRHTDITTSGVEKGVMKSHLTVHSVETEHFGRYRCTVTNHNGNLTLDVTLRKGVPSMVRVKGEYRAALVIMVAALMFLTASVVFWRRCQVAFSLHYRQKKALSSEDHQYDVFLVHGESASGWVCSVLLPVLEDSFGYTCFSPQRDMRGGSMIIEEVAEKVYDCRCVVIVITPCLLENPWAVWALHNAVKAALQARTRLLALLLQDLKPRKGSPDTSGIVGILKHIRKIPVPRPSKWDDSKPKKNPLPQSPPKKEAKVHHAANNLKVLNVDVTVCRSRSKSPKKQKLSNMISGGNMASGDVATDKKECGPVIFLEREDSEDTCSPCSETPFIWPSAADVQKHRPILAKAKRKPSLSTFLSVLCAGDQQEVFWHTFLGWLGPPRTATPHQDASPTTFSA